MTGGAFAAALGAMPAAHAADFVIKVSDAVPAKSPLNRALAEFKQKVEAGSQGRISVRLFPDGQLAGQRESVEGVISGSIEMAAEPSGVLAGFDKDFQLTDIPFVFSTLDQARHFLDSKGQSVLFADLGKQNMVGLAIWEQGFRNLASVKKPVHDLADVANLRVRTMEAPMQIAGWRALGANPTPMGWGQVYTSLQQGVIDAVENPNYVFTDSAVHEVIHSLTLTQHLYDPLILIGNRKFFASLPPELNKLVMDSLSSLTPVERQYAQDESAAAQTAMAKQGIQIITLTPVQRQAFVAQSQPPVIEAIKASLGDAKVDTWLAGAKAAATNASAATMKSADAKAQ